MDKRKSNHMPKFMYVLKNWKKKSNVLFTPEELMDVFAKVHSDDRDIIDKYCSLPALKKLVETQQGVHFEVRMYEENGECRWWRYHLQGILESQERSRCIVMLRTDITEERRAEEERRQQLEDALYMAERSNSAKSDFMSRMSHEIRTPLNAVIGYMAIAQSAKGNEEKIDECIEKAEISAKHLLSVINEVLDMSAIENGKLKIATNPFVFKQLLSDLTTMFYEQAAKKKIHFEVILNDLTEEGLVGDQLRLNQVLVNLLSNAIKFTPKGGQVIMDVTQTKLSKNQVNVLFSVVDTGIGMSRDFRERLFQPFEQQDDNIARNYGGTGLGLSITKNLVTMMGGTIAVDSTEGAGSKFTVELSFETCKSAASDAMPTYDFSKIHALVVDDDEDACEYVRVLLRRYGVRSEGAYSGAEAIQAVIRAHSTVDDYDICLMDWRMPDLDGIETVKRIREIIGEKMPVIIVTAYDYENVRDEAHAAGITSFINKPLFQSTVLNTLVEVCHNAQLDTKQQASEFDFKGRRLLLAEDNEINLEMALEILRGAGFEVDAAANGKEAYEKFFASPVGTYDAILMDIQMPIMDGLTAAKKIRMSIHPEAEQIPILAMTANAFAEDISQSFTAGMNAHISKPIDLQQLFASLGSCMKKIEMS